MAFLEELNKIVVKIFYKLWHIYKVMFYNKDIVLLQVSIVLIMGLKIWY